MKSRFTQTWSMAAIILIFLVTASRGQSVIDDGERNCSDTGARSNRTSVVSDFKFVKEASLKKLRTANTCASTSEDSLAFRNASSLTKLSRPFDSATLSHRKDPATDLNDPQAQANDAQDLAKKLSNPIASLISFPFQSNFDFGMGPEEKGFRYTLNIQPVIPFALTKHVNVISRTIVPVIAQNDVVGSTSQFGVGDTIQSFFFSPNKSEPFIWGVGPQFLIATGTNPNLGTQKFGMGPTFVILKQQKGWTYGALVNHTWSVFGKETRAAVNSTFLQPFVSYTTKKAWTFSVNTESAYDWTGNTWSVPIHFQVSKLTKMGKQPVSVGIASRCWTASGPGGPQGCGFRLVFVPLFPVK